MKHNNKHQTLPAVESLKGCMPSIYELVAQKIADFEEKGLDEAFFIGDLEDVVKKFQTWKNLLPRVEPFYAVKCNQDMHVLKLLAELGTGFDCASKLEIEQMLKLGVDPSRIVYANPCKQRSFVKYAAKHNVDLMTFDNEAELLKVKELFPTARLVLRLLPTSQFKVQCELGNKFGCHPNNVMKLLSKAQELDLNVVGISFHVGSGVEEAQAFACAVEQAYHAFQMGSELGFDMKLLDIGGGFPGQSSAPVTFTEIAEVLNKSLDLYFPESSNIRIIAEPGRYFVASAFTLVVNVIAKRAVARDLSKSDGPPDGHCCQELTQNDEPSYMYYVNDGVYGSFNSLMYDHAKVEANVMVEHPLQFTSSIWGPTCDGLDCIMEECRLPELKIGDWLFFPDMGAYTMAAGSTFNGMPRPECFYYCHVSVWDGFQTEAALRKLQESPLKQLNRLPLKAGANRTFLTSAVCPHLCLPEEEVVVA